MADNLDLKTNYVVDSKLEPIYTGGRIQLSEDGCQLFCACGGEIKVVDVESGKVQISIKSEEDSILNFILSPNDKILVTVSRSGLLKHIEWPTNTSQRLWKSLHKGVVSCMDFDPTSTLLATGGSDSTIKVWDIIRQFCTHNLKGSLGVFSFVKFHPLTTQLKLFGAADDYHIRGWDLTTSKVFCKLEGHVSTVTSISFSSSGTEMISSGRDQVIIVWDTVNYVSLRTIPVFETLESAFILPVMKAFPEIGVTTKLANHFITAGNKGVLRVWSFSGQLIHTQKSDSNPKMITISKAFLNSKTETICMVTDEQNILFHQLDNFALKKQLIGFNDDILDLSYYGKDQSYLAVATNSSIIKIFHTETHSSDLLKGHTDIVMSLSCFPTSSQILASCSKDNSIRLWKMNDDNNIACVAVGTGHTHTVRSVATSRLNAKFVVTGSEDRCLKLWDVPQNIIADGSPFSNPFSLNVRWTVIAHDKDINYVSISPNDKLIASASQDKSIKIWSTSEGTCMADLRGHRRGVWNVQFSPVDQIVASGSADGLIKLWSLTEFNCVMTFEGHESSVLKVIFISKGMQLLSCASDGLIKLWTVRSNECIKTFDGHEGRVWALQVNKHESHFVSGSEDSIIVTWKNVTEIEQEEERKKTEDVLLKEQELSNLLQKKNYFQALVLTITMDQPFRTLNILKEILILPDGEATLQETFKQLELGQIDTVLRFAVIWNQNSKHFHEAQTVINTTLKTFTIERLLSLPNIKSTVESLLPYTERHYKRMGVLLQQATFLEYTWRRMKVADDHKLIAK